MGSIMTQTPSDLLLFSLEELLPYEFEKFKFKLQNASLESEHRHIPRGQLQLAKPVKVASLLVSHYGEQFAMRLTLHILRAINQHLLAEKLHRALGPDYLIQESGMDGSAVRCSSGDSRPRRPRPPDSPERGGQRLSGDGVASLPTGQPETGRASQKKPQGKRKDQKGPEGTDASGKPWARNLIPPARKSLVPGKLPGEKGGSSSTFLPLLRRNSISAGRLQDLSSGPPAGSLAKRDLRMPSEKQRPKSLEIPISLVGAPPNPETPLTQENKDSAPTPSRVAALDGGAAVAVEQGSRDPENSQALEGGNLRSRCSAAPQPGERTREHPNPTESWEKSGIAGPEPPETSGLVAGSACREPTGRPWQQAGCPLCPAQEGTPAGASCVHGPCSYSMEPASPRASGSPSAQPLPQCERHMKQARLLFCEDHGEPICLICRLSQEHRDHRVRPIQEAALEYKEHIQKQLEHLKRLRKSGEERRSQGESETVNFLKEIGIQKQKVQCQLENICHFLKQQEQLFVAKLEEQEQTIGRAGETYGARVSQDVALLDQLIGELEAKQAQPEWELMQDIGAILHRAKMVTVPEPWASPEEVEEKLLLLSQKSKFMEKSVKQFSESLRLEMKTLHVPELTVAQAHATAVMLDPATAHANLILSADLRSVRLGSKSRRLPDSPERFDSCIFTLGLSRFTGGRHYWEVEVGSKTGWILGVCQVSKSRKGSITLTPETGYWVVMMTRQHEYQASTLPPTCLRMKEPPRRVGVFLDYTVGSVSFYNVTAKAHVYTFTSPPPSGPLQPIFSPGTHDGGRNMDPLTICPVGGPGPH